MEDLLAAPIGALLIFGLRVADVSLGMVRMLFALRGYRVQAALIGFIEILIWIFAIGAALQHLSSPLHIVGYAAGFAAGNYVGVWVEEHFAMGTNVVRAVCRNEQGKRENAKGAGHAAATALRDRGFAVTEIKGHGREHPVDILNIVAQRKQVPEVIEVVQGHDPDAFVTVEDVRSYRGGYLRRRPLRLPFRSR